MTLHRHCASTVNSKGMSSLGWRGRQCPKNGYTGTEPDSARGAPGRCPLRLWGGGKTGATSHIDPARESARSGAIRLALRELGYIEGQTIPIEYRYAEGKPDRYPELAAELVRLKDFIPL